MCKLSFILCLLSLTTIAQDLPLKFVKENWQVLEYSSIKANVVEFNGTSLKLTIDGSASPLIYPLQKGKTVKAVKLKGNIQGSLNLKEGVLQGKDDNDDFMIRIGLVYEGDQRLNFFQRQVAASWVLKLFSLAPKDKGVDHIFFVNSYSDDRLKGKTRDHPASDLLKEYFILPIQGKSSFDIEIPIPNPKTTLAVWVSSDGDNSKSKYSVEFNEIILK